MSTIISAACWPLDGMTPLQKVVLISLADNANDQGYCWPSIPTIAKRACSSPRGAQKAIQWLESVGLIEANRKNGRHTTYTVTPQNYRTDELCSGGVKSPTPEHIAGGRKTRPPEQSSPANIVHPRTEFTGEHSSSAPEQSSPHPRNAFVKPTNTVPSNRKEPSKEPSLNRQGARPSPRVGLTDELRNREIPEWLPRETWLDWCEHREALQAKKKSAPWTRPAAKVTLQKLEQLHGLGFDCVLAVNESVLRGWTGIWEAKVATRAEATAGGAPDGWWKAESGWLEQGKRLGIESARFQYFEQFKAKVCKTLGPGAWMEHLLASVSRESEERGELLFAYLNGVAREQVAHAEAA